MKNEKHLTEDEKRTSRTKLNSHKKLGSWIQIIPNYVSIMSVAEAYLLSYLVDKEYMVFTGPIKMSDKKRKLVNQGWFFCKMKTVVRETHLQSKRQSRIFSQLEKRGFITTKRIGMPPLRWIKINVDNIIEAFDYAYDKHFKLKENYDEQ